MPGGTGAADGVDFAMLANEVKPVMTVMLGQGLHIDCLYNQETDEHPQLYFSHQLNVGDPDQLAHSVRPGLEQTGVNFISASASARR
ncbi:MAG: DUF1259 domain-containing protein [Rhodomicrobium sp.]